MGAGGPGAPRSRLPLRAYTLPRACTMALHGTGSQHPPPRGGFRLLLVPLQGKNKKGEAVAWAALAVWFWGKSRSLVAQ